MKRLTLLAGVIASSFMVATQAQELEITVTNLTQGIYYTPILIAAHNTDIDMFTVGEAASNELQAMAEGGDISGLSTLVTAGNADIVENPAGGLLAPASSTTTTLNTMEGNTHLSLVSMMLPTNDGFIGLDSWMIPSESGTYSFTLSAYDAGTEANDEIINGGGAPGVAGIPIAPGNDAGAGGAGVTSMEENTMIHVHRGNLGDDDLSGGKSDLDNTVHRWLNPVARVTVVVK
ncbi:spondin domain-containing protein [Thalassotalea fusca]